MKAGVGIFRGFGTAGGWQPQPHSAHAERAPNIASASPKRWISRTYITYGCMRSGCARGSTVAALRALHVFPTQLSQGRTIPQTKTCQNEIVAPPIGKCPSCALVSRVTRCKGKQLACALLMLHLEMETPPRRPPFPSDGLMWYACTAYHSQTLLRALASSAPELS